MAINAQGSKVLHSSASSPAAFTAIEQVTSITGPTGTLKLIDTSHLGSTRKEYLPGLADNGTIQLKCNFTAGTKQMEMFDLFNASSDASQFQIKIPTDSTRTVFYTFDFMAIVTKWALTETVDDKVGLDIELQTTGGVTYTP